MDVALMNAEYLSMSFPNPFKQKKISEDFQTIFNIQETKMTWYLSQKPYLILYGISWKGVEKDGDLSYALF